MQTVKLKVVFTVFMLLCQGAIIATPVPKDVEGIGYVRQELQRIIDANEKYKENFHEHIPAESLQSQAPDATVVLCSDSRVDTASFSEAPAGSLFVIRNIGNQVVTASGSVEYGVNYLHTPMMIVIGHSGCGAVKAAMGDYRKESQKLKAELITLDVDSKASLNRNIVFNVHNQVKSAVAEFKSRVVDNKLLVIGMVYDLHNDFHYGYGQMILVNINNETNPQALAENPYVKGLRHLAILNYRTNSD